VENIIKQDNMSKVKDKLWIWGHEAGSHNNGCGIKGTSRMTPVEGAFYLGVPNLIMVRYANKPIPPFDQYAIPLGLLDRVVWSIVSTASSPDNELPLVRALNPYLPNLCGVIMDDFFERRTDQDGNKVAVFTPEELANIQNQLKNVPKRKLDLWVTLYARQLNLPIREHLKQCDVVTLWIWHAKEIDNLKQNLERAKKLASSSHIVLGCYMWDYGGKKPMSISLMKKQCQIGLRWLQERRIEGMIFLASCICDLKLEAVEWTRKWIQEVGEENING